MKKRVQRKAANSVKTDSLHSPSYAADAFVESLWRRSRPSRAQVEKILRDLLDPDAIPLSQRLGPLSDMALDISILKDQCFPLGQQASTDDEDSEVWKVRRHLKIANQAIRELRKCSREAQIEVASAENAWPVIVDPHDKASLNRTLSELKNIKIGSRPRSGIGYSSIFRQPSREKLVAILLYDAVDTVVRFFTGLKSTMTQDKRNAFERMALRLDVLIHLVDAYDINEWRETDKVMLGKKLAAVLSVPIINAGSFNTWFAACRAALVCLTKNEFHLPRHMLREVGRTRATLRGGDKTVRDDAYYREGIMESMKSALKTALGFSRVKPR